MAVTHPDIVYVASNAGDDMDHLAFAKPETPIGSSFSQNVSSVVSPDKTSTSSSPSTSSYVRVEAKHDTTVMKDHSFPDPGSSSSGVPACELPVKRNLKVQTKEFPTGSQSAPVSPRPSSVRSERKRAQEDDKVHYEQSARRRSRSDHFHL